MAKATKKTAIPKPNGQAGVYYIVGGRPNHKVLMPERDEVYMQAVEDEKTGKLGILKAEFPKVRNPKALLTITDQRLKLWEELGEKAQPNGDFITEDPEIAAKAWKGLQKINSAAYIHPMSLPIPGA